MTNPDLPPKLISSLGSSRAIDADLVFTFSEDIRAGSGAILLQDYMGQIVFSIDVGSSSVQITGNILTLHLPQYLAYDSRYTVSFDNRVIRDFDGQFLQYSVDEFTTVPDPVALRLTGTDGNDVLRGGPGKDALEGGAGDDSLYGDDGNDNLSDDQGSNLLDGGAGNDNLRALNGASGNSTLDGGTGNDTITAGGGNHVVRGGDGDDIIQLELSSWTTFHLTADGGDGADSFIINQGSHEGDTLDLTGGAGRDSYRWASNWELPPTPVKILDFRAGADGDLLDVMSLLSTSWRGPNPFSSGHVRLLADGTDTLLQIDPDGAAGSQGYTTVAVLKGVAPAH